MAAAASTRAVSAAEVGPACPGCMGTAWMEVTPEDRSCQLFRCPICGCERMEVPLPRLAPAELYEDYYSKGAAKRVAGVFDGFWCLMRRQKAKLIGRSAPPAGAICDVGCERGELLNVLKRSGFVVQGTQLSTSAADFARKEFGIDVYVGELTEAPFDSETFDAVLMINVLEHLPRPEEYVAHIWKILRPGGHFWIEVPNTASFTARLSRKRWLHADPDHHYWGFDRDSLSRLLGRHRFGVEQVHNWSWEHGPIGCVQSWMNFLPGPRGVIFQIVREGLSRRPDRLAVQLLHGLLAAALLPLAIVVSTLESLAGDGQVILLRARKITDPMSGPRWPIASKIAAGDPPRMAGPLVVGWVGEHDGAIPTHP